jgi:hypothetical protein
MKAIWDNIRAVDVLETMPVGDMLVEKVIDWRWGCLDANHFDEPVERLRQPRNEEAWRRFFDLYAPVLLACARRYNLPAADQADLVQDVLFKSLRTSRASNGAPTVVFAAGFGRLRTTRDLRECAGAIRNP